MVAQGGHVIAHSTHQPQLRSGCGIDGLVQSSHGKVSAVQSDNGTGGILPLFLQQGGNAGKAAVLPAALGGSGAHMGMHVVGKQDGQLFPGTGTGGQGGQRSAH